MKTMKTLTTLALGLATAASAFALTDGPYVRFYPGANLTTYSTLAWPGNASISLPSFNTTLGVLDSIDFTWLGKAGITMSAHNPNDASDVTGLTLQGQGTLTIKTPGGIDIAVALPTVTKTQATLGPLQTASFAETFNTVSDVQTIANSNEITTPAILTAFSTSGASTLVLPLTATLGTLSGTTIGNIDQLSIIGKAVGRATITYNYHINNNVPEPKVYGAIGAVACLGLLGYRRFRKQQA